MVTLPQGQGPSVESNFSNMLGQIIGTLYGSKAMGNQLGAALFGGGQSSPMQGFMNYFQNPTYAKYPSSAIGATPTAQGQPFYQTQSAGGAWNHEAEGTKAFSGMGQQGSSGAMKQAIGSIIAAMFAA